MGEGEGLLKHTPEHRGGARSPGPVAAPAAPHGAGDPLTGTRRCCPAICCLCPLPPLPAGRWVFPLKKKFKSLKEHENESRYCNFCKTCGSGPSVPAPHSRARGRAAVSLNPASHRSPPALPSATRRSRPRRQGFAR